MSKVNVVFSDTGKDDSKGNPVVDIATMSIPRFPDNEIDYSPAQKAAIQFLSRGSQPEFQTLLAKLNAEAILLESEWRNISDNLTEENCGSLPLDLALIQQRVVDFRSMIEEAIGSYN